MTNKQVMELYKRKTGLEKELRGIKSLLGEIAEEHGEGSIGQLKVIHHSYARRADGEDFKIADRMDDLGMTDWTWRGMDSRAMADTMKVDLGVPEQEEWEGFVWQERYWLAPSRYGKR